MIFISGVHGVGKGYFCNLVNKELGIESYTASDLISKGKDIDFDSNKLVSDIEDNQLYLLAAVRELKKNGTNFILDGHFCLNNKDTGKVARISLRTFTDLDPDTIILLTEKPEIISKRRKERDGLDVTPESIKEFQNTEKQYAEEVAQLLGAKLFISTGADDLPAAIDFLRSH
jgi:adenylate kinase